MIQGLQQESHLYKVTLLAVVDSVNKRRQTLPKDRSILLPIAVLRQATDDRGISAAGGAQELEMPSAADAVRHGSGEL